MNTVRYLLNERTSPCRFGEETVLCGGVYHEQAVSRPPGQPDTVF